MNSVAGESECSSADGTQNGTLAVDLSKAHWLIFSKRLSNPIDIEKIPFPRIISASFESGAGDRRSKAAARLDGCVVFCG